MERHSKVNRAWFSALSLCVLSQLGCDESNTAPDILPLSELLAPVNQSAEIAIFARDTEGDPLAFSFTFEPPPRVFTEGELGQPTLTPVSTTQAIFQWVPSIADVGVYSLTITATDPDGLSGSETIRLEVFSESVGDQSMRFSSPVGAGQSLDTRVEPCLDMSIEVTADGIRPEDILIDLPSPSVEGAELTPAGDLTGKERRVRWCPSAAQLAEAERYTLTLRARRRLDQEVTGGEMAEAEVWSEGITKRYLIRLESGTSPLDGECVGRPPSINHTSPSQVSGLDDYLVELDVYDDLGIKSPPLLAIWPESSPPNVSLDDPRWLLSELTPDLNAPNLWLGVIPNLNLSVGEEVTVYYGFIVTDNDDPTGARCDHTVESAIYELRAIGGIEGGARSICEPCTHDAQCGGADDLCLVYTEGTFCGRFCSDEAPCDSGQECLALTSADGLELSQCVPLSLSCVGVCTPDAFDADQSLSAEAAPLLAEGYYPDLAICDEPLDIYQLEIPASRGVEVSLSFEASSMDLDLFLALGGEVDEQGQLVFQYESNSANRSPERIRVGCASPSGPERAWIAVSPYDQGDRGSYQLSINYPPEGCSEGCTDDVLESPGAAPIQDGYYDALQLCPADQDLFVFEVQAGWVISALINFNVEDGDLQLGLYGPDQTLLLRDEGTRSGALVEWRAEQTGVYALEVAGATSLIQNQYSLDLYLFPTEPCIDNWDCAPDTFCYPQLGCLENYCTPTIGCGFDQRCVYPILSAPNPDEGRCGMLCMSDQECRAHERCKPVDSGGGVCVEVGFNDRGASCTRHQECLADLICADFNAEGVCLRADCNACVGGEECVSVGSRRYCLPSCEAGCPTGWSCDGQWGQNVCSPP